MTTWLCSACGNELETIEASGAIKECPEHPRSAPTMARQPTREEVQAQVLRDLEASVRRGCEHGPPRLVASSLGVGIVTLCQENPNDKDLLDDLRRLARYIESAFDSLYARRRPPRF